MNLTTSRTLEVLRRAISYLTRVRHLLDGGVDDLDVADLTIAIGDDDELLRGLGLLAAFLLEEHHHDAIEDFSHVIASLDAPSAKDIELGRCVAAAADHLRPFVGLGPGPDRDPTEPEVHSMELLMGLGVVLCDMIPDIELERFALDLARLETA
jgi:hypothetical protein